MGPVITRLIEEFVEQARLRKYSEKTISSYRMSLNHFAQYLDLHQIKDIRQIDLEVLNLYKKHLLEEPYTLETVHLKLRAMKRLFEYLEKTCQLLVNPCERFIMPSVGARLPKNILTQDEVQKILSYPNTSLAIGIRDRAILELLYSTGPRLSECLNMKVYDIDLEGGHLRINQGKGSKDRIVPLGRKACQWLREYLNKVRPFYLKRAQEPDERSLWIGQEGRSLSPLWLNRLLNQYAQKAGIAKPVTVHTFRRTLATHMLNAGAHPYYIQQLLGHRHMDTLSRYIKLVAKDLKSTHKRHHPRERDRDVGAINDPVDRVYEVTS